MTRASGSAPARASSHVGSAGSLRSSASPPRERAMTLLLGSLTIGLILALLALGVFVSFRVFHFPDITTDGSLTLGASVAAALLVAGFAALVATLAGACAGLVAGATTGVLHTRFRIQGLLAGILVMTALYSINLHIMGKSNLPLLEAETLATHAAQLGTRIVGARRLELFGFPVDAAEASVLAAAFAASGL